MHTACSQTEHALNQVLT